MGLRTLGDVILTTGSFSFLKEALPGCRIDYLTRHAYADLLREEPALHRVLTLPTRTGGSRWRDRLTYLRFLDTIRRERYDLVVDLFSRGPRSRVITWWSGARRRMGLIDHENRIDRMVNRIVYTDRVAVPVQIDRMVDRIPYLLSRIKKPRVYPLPALCVSSTDLSAAREMLSRVLRPGRPYWIFFYGSGISSKNWPVDRFAEIARRLAESGVDVFCLGGEMERTLQESLRHALGGPVPGIHVHLQVPWGLLKGLCHMAEGVLGNDSGPIHLAQASGCPALVLFGPGDHVSYAPFLGRAIRGQLACQPCQAFSALCPDNRCMTALLVDTVWAEIRDHRRQWGHSRAAFGES